MFVPLYSFASSREYTQAEATPPFCASTPMPRTRVSSPFLRRMPPCVTLELGTCTKPGTRRRPVPQTRRRLRQSGGSSPSSPAPARYARCRDGSRAPPPGESSQEREGYRYLERASSLVPPRRHIY
ncbi:hypothetical protein G5714_014754 [Onychostoma macrolepis]|uniref:Uncharacterized protein n=1 Tax=Onychostoma macrolepis TaxID=369639 RepID=A0A7J6C8Y2_9TELE|nr:hypothetical protein G5714_014754 [Onychostoma macrolepis]